MTHRLCGFDCVGRGRTLDVQADGELATVPGCIVVIVEPVAHGRDIADHHLFAGGTANNSDFRHAVGGFNQADGTDLLGACPFQVAGR